MDRMRESVFACLPPLLGLSFLDLFSGSGIIALEAASRGAAQIEAVEMDKGKSRVLIDNVAISPVRINCRFMPVELYVARSRRAFDIIFCDPPFPYKDKAGLVSSIAASALMGDGSVLLLHYPSGDAVMREGVIREGVTPLKGAAPLKLTDRREYGRSVVDFFLKA
jgi:16S rRNA (guanine(966)-N(2))-methyltransferase RsmD